MKIVFMSDSHGKTDAVRKIVKDNPDADMFVHLGDGEGDVAAVRREYPEIKILNVCGNCDPRAEGNEVLLAELDGGHKLFAAHGHKYGVKMSDLMIRNEARKNGATLVAFGHTHEPLQTYEDGLWVLNPGSCSCPPYGQKPSYARADVTAAGIITGLVWL